MLCSAIMVDVAPGTRQGPHRLDRMVFAASRQRCATGHERRHEPFRAQLNSC
jgi:hypothetical protein